MSKTTSTKEIGYSRDADVDRARPRARTVMRPLIFFGIAWVALWLWSDHNAGGQLWDVMQDRARFATFGFHVLLAAAFGALGLAFLRLLLMFLPTNPRVDAPLGAARLVSADRPDRKDS